MLAYRGVPFLVVLKERMMMRSYYLTELLYVVGKDLLPNGKLRVDVKDSVKIIH